MGLGDFQYYIRPLTLNRQVSGRSVDGAPNKHYSLKQGYCFLLQLLNESSFWGHIGDNHCKMSPKIKRIDPKTKPRKPHEIGRFRKKKNYA